MYKTRGRNRNRNRNRNFYMAGIKPHERGRNTKGTEGRQCAVDASRPASRALQSDSRRRITDAAQCGRVRPASALLSSPTANGHPLTSATRNHHPALCPTRPSRSQCPFQPTRKPVVPCRQAHVPASSPCAVRATATRAIRNARDAERPLL